MRTPLTALFAVVAGVHCSAPSYGGEEVAADEISTEESAPRAVGTTSSDKGSDSNTTEDARWAINAEGLPPMLFTSSVRGEDGALYAAGTFAGAVTVGGDTFYSKGADDVVLVRLDASGHITWGKSIGSTLAERKPKVTFVDGTVRILAETQGQVDCGSGEMGKWSSEMFFYCLYDPDGTALGGGTFPTGEQ
jgi:hypothetical protein